MRRRRFAIPALVALPLAGFGGPTALSGQDTHPLQGSWSGVLQTPGGQLPLVAHFEQSEEGWTGALDSPAQGQLGIPMSSVTLDEGGTIRWAIGGLQASWEGRLDEDRLVGTFAQGGASMPFEMDRAEEGSAATTGPARPQTPEGPFPYDEIDLRFPSLDGGFELAGTLTVPHGDGPWPGVVLITGSGPQNRNEALAGHEPFRVLADHLSRSGIAVLRYDDRGVAESGGDFASATTLDLADDAEAALTALRARGEIDSEAVGFLGHSEGGLVAPIVGARNDQVNFAILLAGTSIDGESVLIDQTARMISAATNDALAAFNTRIQERIFASFHAESDPTARAERIRTDLEAYLAEQDPTQMAQIGIPADRGPWIEQQVQAVSGPWMAFFLTLDPAPILEQLDMPVLALFGSLDMQVHPDANAPGMRAALAGNPNATVEVIPGMNHLFQEAGTGSPSEYATIEQTMSPIALNRMSTWILEVTGR
jgi:dienelactone hydrolase